MTTAADNRDHTLVFGPGSVIFREGEPGTCAYLIRDGKVDISVRNRNGRVFVARLGKGEVFGELALVDGAPRSATATSSQGCELFVVTKKVLNKELGVLDPFMHFWIMYMTECIRRSLKRMDNLPKDSPGRSKGWLEEWVASPRERPQRSLPAGNEGGDEVEITAEIVKSLERHYGGDMNFPGHGIPAKSLILGREGSGLPRRRLEDGDVLFLDGAPGTEAYLVVSGTILICKGDLQNPIVLAEVSEGRLFGELSLIDGKPRTASAVAKGPTELLVIDAARFRDKVSRCSNFIQMWAKTLTTRLRNMSERIHS